MATVAAWLEAAGPDAGHHLVLGRAGIGRAFAAHEVARREVRADGVERVPHIGEVGLEMGVERSRHAENDGVCLGHAGEVGRGIEPPRGPGRSHVGRRDRVDIAPPSGDRLRLGRVDVEADHAAAGLGEGERER